jgi:hypothetical protein
MAAIATTTAAEKVMIGLIINIYARVDYFYLLLIPHVHAAD